MKHRYTPCDYLQFRALLLAGVLNRNSGVKILKRPFALAPSSFHAAVVQLIPLKPATFVVHFVTSGVTLVTFSPAHGRSKALTKRITR